MLHEKPSSPDRDRPAYPETPSTFSRWALRCELALTTAISIAVLIFMNRSRVDEYEPFTGTTWHPPIEHPADGAGEASAESSPADGPDSVKGQALFMQSCTPCHGPGAQGLPRMGVDLRQSEFVAKTSDLRLIAFLKSGRGPMDPKNSTGIPMPPRGGNFALDDQSLADIVAFLRQVQKQ